jgi:hypothetical protein
MRARKPLTEVGATNPLWCSHCRRAIITGMSTTAASRDLHVGRYRFFGSNVEFISDSLDVVRTLDIVYERQRWPLGDDTADSREEKMAASGADPVRVFAFGGEDAHVTVNGRTIRVPAGDQLAHYAHLIMINVAAAFASGLSVLHSGAVARDGQAVLLVGSSGHGKTTLTLELMRRGWRFLSDDFAPIEPTGTVRPFPRRVNVTDASLVLLGIQPPAGGMRLPGFGGQSKWMLDPEELQPGCLGGSAMVRTVFLLGASAEADSGPWTFQLDRASLGLAEAVGRVHGVVAARLLRGGPVVTMHVDVAPGARVIPQLDSLFAEADVTVLNSARGAARRAAFEGPVTIRPIDIKAALPRLLAHDLGLSGRRFLGHGADPLVALQRLHAAVAVPGARVYELETGPISATADAITEVAQRY